MRATIHRRTYNTETATEIGYWNNGKYTSDFSFYEEMLYITTKGNYFIHGVGNALSKYAESSGNTLSGGSKILPITESEAIEWCEKTSNEDTIEKYFKDLVQDA
jgi:hypothetical protein